MGRHHRRRKESGNNETTVLENVGVILRPEGAGTSARLATMKRLRGEGIVRARLLEYSNAAIVECYRAFGSDVKLVVSIPDDEVDKFGSDYSQSSSFAAVVGPWIEKGVVDAVLVGVTPPSGVGADVRKMTSLANATRNVARACREVAAEVPVSTGFSLSVLRSSFPPSASLFAAPGPLEPVLNHLLETKAPFVIELDPYLAWRQSYYDISLDYALFGLEYPQLKDPEFTDASNGAEYFNLFDAMVDAVRWALYREGLNDLQVVVSSVGWPSGYYGSFSDSDRRRRQQQQQRGGPFDTSSSGSGGGSMEKRRRPPAAGPTFAAQFNSRLARHLNCTRSAVPLDDLRPDGCAPLVAYIFEGDDYDYDNSGDSYDSSRSGTLKPLDEEDEPPLAWGVCSGNGRLKYSIRTGVVFPPDNVVPHNTNATGWWCPFDADCSPTLLVVACLFLAVALLSAGAFSSSFFLVHKKQSRGGSRRLRRPPDDDDDDDDDDDGTTTTTKTTRKKDEPPRTPEDEPSNNGDSNGGDSNGHSSSPETWWSWLFAEPKPRRLPQRHTADSVAAIIRKTRFTAEENSERSRRLRERSGYGSRGFFSRSYYLHRIAEGPSPLPSDDEDGLLLGAAPNRLAGDAERNAGRFSPPTTTN